MFFAQLAGVGKVSFWHVTFIAKLGLSLSGKSRGPDLAFLNIYTLVLYFSQHASWSEAVVSDSRTVMLEIAFEQH